MKADLIEAARLGGRILKAGFDTEKGVEYKGAIDLVTRFDREVEHVVVAELKTRFPTFEVVAEEGGGHAGSDGIIYVDPIDGTTNFVHGIPFCAVSIGVVVAGEPIAGVVFNPLSVSGRETLRQGLIATGFPYSAATPGPKFHWLMGRFEALVTKARGVRRLGSAALDLCYTAKGVFDGYYEAELKPWDVAAGIAIVQAAGGRVTGLDGKAFDVTSSEPIVATNEKIHEALLDVIGGEPYPKG